MTMGKNYEIKGYKDWRKLFDRDMYWVYTLWLSSSLWLILIVLHDETYLEGVIYEWIFSEILSIAGSKLQTGYILSWVELQDLI